MNLDFFDTLFEPFHREKLYVCSIKTDGGNYEKGIVSVRSKYACLGLSPTATVAIGMGREL